MKRKFDEAGTTRNAKGIGRRAFLTGSALTAAGGAFAAASGGAKAAAVENDSADPKDSPYRETEHVRRFYERSRF